MIEGIAVAGLVVGTPAALLALMVALDRFEASYVQPNERAAVLADLVASSRDPDEIEQAVAQLLASAAPAPRSDRRP
jgi:hypothetical protein